ncbi:exosome complex component MTR3-like isoform X3 [Oratosquilla oratoria]|uniref:exosome complex component MTR3-like isoform X3 n=1 Tax=Oratosquilla oratoria TaxID=337810 RepID=UPI003F76616F
MIYTNIDRLLSPPTMSGNDPRRLRGPKKSFPYTVFQKFEKKSFLDEGTASRRDGRAAVDARKIFLTVGVLSKARGSSYIEFGNTKVMCGVYGPKEVDRPKDFKMKGQVMCEVKFAPFSGTKRRPPQPDRQQREINRQIKDTLEAVLILEKFPKSQIDVYLTVVEDDGGVLAACVTAAGLALAQGSFDTFDLVVGASLMWHRDMLYVDPTREEEAYASVGILSEGKNDLPENLSEAGKLTVGLMPMFANGQVALFVQEGEVEASMLSEAVTLSTDLCQRIYRLSQETLLEYVEKKISKEDGTVK